MSELREAVRAQRQVVKDLERAVRALEKELRDREADDFYFHHYEPAVTFARKSGGLGYYYKGKLYMEIPLSSIGLSDDELTVGRRKRLEWLMKPGKY